MKAQDVTQEQDNTNAVERCGAGTRIGIVIGALHTIRGDA